MFFLLSKILGFFLLPSNFLVMAGLFGAVLLATRFRRAGCTLMVMSLVILAVLGLSPIGNILLMPLEDRFPPWKNDGGEVAGVVVLGGAVWPHLSLARDAVAVNEAAERLTTAARLAAEFPRAKIIFAGGDAGLVRQHGVEATHGMRLLRDLGIPQDRLISETRSRNTIENARFSKVIARPNQGERWLLVTSAYHMPRAIGVFRREGFDIEAHPVDWRTRGALDALRPFRSVGDGLKRTDTAMREWIGLLAYWLTGKTSALFPGP